MSTMVASSTYPLAELHKDFQTNLIGRDSIDLGFALNSAALGTTDGFSLMNNASLAGMWSLQRPSVARRNSTSSVSSITATRNRLNTTTNPLTSIANIIPEASTATITAAASILSSIPATDERFRGRAYSEGAASLPIDSTLQSRYKTELCRPFEENGKCKYGDKCQFAHGKQELRPLNRHPKYKTELCRTFHTSGFCPYGPRCHFIHNQEDSTSRPSNNVQTGPSPTGGLNQQAVQQHNAFSAAMLPRCAPVAVPNPQISERNHFNHRPSQLDILKQLKADLGGMAYPQPSLSPPNNSPPPYYHGDIGSTVLMSPTSPNSTSSGNMFNFSNLPTQSDLMVNTTSGLASMLQYEMQHSPPTMSTFDMFRSQGIQETTVNDDSAFETPPDSDRESLTGSPPGKQRLPIFRCLSQSE